MRNVAVKTENVRQVRNIIVMMRRESVEIDTTFASFGRRLGNANLIEVGKFGKLEKSSFRLDDSTLRYFLR
jgi:hypothetical protein